MRGMRGENQAFGFFIDISGGIGIIFSIVFVISYALLVNWRYSVSIVVINFIALPLSELFSSGDDVWKWLLGTIAIWPLMPVIIWLAFF